VKWRIYSLLFISQATPDHDASDAAGLVIFPESRRIFLGTDYRCIRPYQLAALVGRHLIFLDGSRDGALRIRGIDYDDELRGRALDVVDSPAVGCLLLLGRSLRHRG
jgi:hypothetical protein